MNRSLRRRTLRIMTNSPLSVLLMGLVCCCAWGCSESAPPESQAEAPREWPPKVLSEFALFAGDPKAQQSAEGVIPYDLITPLFSDYMGKQRFVKLPPGESAAYHAEQEFDLPVGTVIAKTFTLPADLRDPSKGERLLETRILSHEPRGWVGLPYIWNDEQTEAELKVGGRTMDVEWVHYDGETRKNNYIIPNVNQCKGCHETRDKTFLPIGIKARNMNHDFAYADGTENQLAHWTRIGALTGCPAPADAPAVPKWDEPSSGSLEDRARAWLDINCAHCHTPRGPARNSGLDLAYTQRTPYDFGVFRSPVAAGAGSGGRRYDIVPGKPDDSIIAFRIASTHPGVMMPELGKRMIHEEGVALVREWIASMPEESPNANPPAAPANSGL